MTNVYEEEEVFPITKAKTKNDPNKLTQKIYNTNNMLQATTTTKTELLMTKKLHKE